jgi:hypothetical protein
VGVGLARLLYHAHSFATVPDLLSHNTPPS